jgi:hypothetical protein
VLIAMQSSNVIACDRGSPEKEAYDRLELGWFRGPEIAR